MIAVLSLPKNSPPTAVAVTTSLPLPARIVFVTTLSPRASETDETLMSSDPAPPSTVTAIVAGAKSVKSEAFTVIVSSPDPPSTQAAASTVADDPSSTMSRSTATRSLPAPPKIAVVLKRLDSRSSPARP